MEEECRKGLVAETRKRALSIDFNPMLKTACQKDLGQPSRQRQARVSTVRTHVRTSHNGMDTDGEQKGHPMHSRMRSVDEVCDTTHHAYGQR